MHYDVQNIPLSQIVINPYVQEELERLTGELSNYRLDVHYAEDFLIEHAKAVTKSAYIAEPSTKFIIMAALSFNDIVQNALLKILEEPPRNIRFILIVPTKSVLLPTVLSRLPFLRRQPKAHPSLEAVISFRQFDLAAMQNFLKAHERVSKNEAKALLEQLCSQAVQDLGTLNLAQAQAFEDGFVLLELNGRPFLVLSALLLQFLPKNLS